VSQILPLWLCVIGYVVTLFAVAFIGPAAMAYRRPRWWALLGAVATLNVLTIIGLALTS
jgi:hypothetical protein